MKRKTIPLADVMVGEEEAFAVFDVVKSTWLSEGKLTKGFEEKLAEYLGVKHVVTCSNGTVALHIALQTLGIGKGDQVIIPSFTCAPPINMIILSGATPYFVDIETETYNINVDLLCRHSYVTRETKAMLPINYGGHPADLEVLQEICDSHGIHLINDCAEALGSTVNGRNVATFGDISTFSLYTNKTITIGEGGAIATNDDELARKARIIKNHGLRSPEWRKWGTNWIMWGNNYRITEMQAAIGLIQLGKIDQIIEEKRKNAKKLTDSLSKIGEEVIPPKELEGYKHTYMLYSVRLPREKRDAILDGLNKRGIQSKVYFNPMHLSPYLKQNRNLWMAGSLNNTIQVSQEILSLPTSPKLTEDEISYIAQTLKDLLEKT